MAPWLGAVFGRDGISKATEPAVARVFLVDGRDRGRVGQMGVEPHIIQDGGDLENEAQRRDKPRLPEVLVPDDGLRNRLGVREVVSVL